MYFCYFDFIIIQFELPLTMPPKNKQKNESKRMQANRIDVAAIERIIFIYFRRTFPLRE